MTKLEQLERDAKALGLYIRTWAPGDGVRRYRFFKENGTINIYFGPQNGIYTALGLKEARKFLETYVTKSVLY